MLIIIHIQDIIANSIKADLSYRDRGQTICLQKNRRCGKESKLNISEVMENILHLDYICGNTDVYISQILSNRELE